MSVNRKIYSIALPACLFWCVLLSVSCDRSAGPDFPLPGDAVSLRFSASASAPGPSGTRAVGPLITAFPEDGTESVFGMSLAKGDGSLLFAGSGHVRMHLRKTGGTWQSSLHTSDGATDLTEKAIVLPGARIRVRSWYPGSDWQRGDDGTIPFDFRGDMETVPQKELLFVAPGDQLQSVGDDGKVDLSFSHAWTHIVINVKKATAAGVPVNISGVGIDNQGKFWIRNRGRIDPSTGLRVPESDTEADVATAGAVGGNRIAALSATDNTTYEFFVPSFMSREVEGESVALYLRIGAIRLDFPLKRIHLNSEGTGDTTRYGFRQGYKNTYNLVYDNTAMSLSLSGWTSVSLDYNFEIPKIQTAEVTYKPGGWTMPDGAHFTHTILPANQKHMYHDWLGTVALRDNGNYVPVRGSGATYPDVMEKVADTLWVSKSDAGLLSVEWSVADGSLVAKELCRTYGDGKWRLPRASEFRMMLLDTKGNPRQLLGLSPDRPYWTGTEVDADRAWLISYEVVSGTDDALQAWCFESTLKTQKAYVRCVRDKALPSK